MANINDPTHKALEQDAIDLFKEYGFSISEATYHSVMDDSVVKILQDLWTPTALYLRGRADRVAVRKSPPMALQWEAKTHESKKYHDMTLEVLPVCAYLALCRLGIDCLYVYRDPPTIKNKEIVHLGYEKGFWICNIPDPRVIMIPQRWPTQALNQVWTEKCKDRIRSFFPDTPIRITNQNYGSGDPFLIIDESVVVNLPDWREIIKGL